MADLDAVQLGAREIYDAVRELGTRLAVLVERDSARATDVADHEKRIRRLEERRWPLPVLAVLLSALAVVVAIVGVLVTR